ncbi:MAG: hypothetical protein ACFFBJ_10430 [Promethearchaeota archaeon]
MTEDHEDNNNEEEDHGNIIVKFCVLLVLGLILLFMIAMFFEFILDSLGLAYHAFPSEFTISVVFVIGFVCGYILRDLSLRKPK